MYGRGGRLVCDAGPVDMGGRHRANPLKRERHLEAFPVRGTAGKVIAPPEVAMASMRRLGWMTALALVVGLARGAHADEPPPAEAFDPALDMPAVGNFGGTSADTRDGVCSGVIELAMTWREARRADPTLPRLAEALAQVERNGGGEERVKALLTTAQDVSAKAWRDGVSMSVPHPDDPGAMSRAIEATVARGETPRLLLVPPAGKASASITGGNHTVAVYGTRRVGDTIEMLVADNRYASTDPRAGTVTLIAQRTADGRGVQWVEKVGGAGGVPSSSRVWGTALLHERPPSDPSKLRALVTTALAGKTDREARAAIGIGIEGPIGGGASAVKDPKAGGVWVSFDPGSFDGERDEASLEAFTDALRRVGGGEASGAVVLPPAGRREELTLVSVASLVAPSVKTVGRLTRVRGYARTAAGELFVVGVVEPDAEPIDVDVLIVALRAVWRDGTTPFVSLDPAPGDPLGDPVPRLGGVPDDAKDSSFLRILLAADYRMKEILLGSREVAEPGVRSLAALLRERDPQVREVSNRFWLAPLSALGADVLETRRGDATAVWFQSRAQVLTEEMLDGPAGLGPAGQSDPLAREAADRMTAAWPRLFGEVPVFRRAATAFDCAKLCTLLRIRGEKGQVLADLATREIAHGAAAPVDEPTPPFRSVGPIEVAGTAHMVFGGARAKARVRQAGIVRTDRLGAVLDAAEAANGGEARLVTIELPVAVDIDAAAAQAVTAELSLAGAQAFLLRGDPAEALKRLDVAVEADRDDAELRYWRAVARTALNRHEEAIDDLGHALAGEPRARALRGFLLARTGPREAAVADLAAVEKETPADRHARAVAVLGYLELGDVGAAEGSVRALRALAPFERRTQALELLVRRARRMSPEDAARDLRWRREIPAEIQAGLVRGDALRVADPDAAVRAWEETLTLAEASTAPSVRELEVSEKLRLLIVYVGSAAAVRPGGDPAHRAERAVSLRRYADASAVAFPDRPTPRLLQATAAQAAVDADPAEIGRFIAEAVARKGAPDPILRDLGEILDTDSPLEILGFSIAWRLWDDAKDARAVLEAVIALLGERPPSASFRALLEHPEFNLATWTQALGQGRGSIPEASDTALRALREADAAFPDERLEGGPAIWFAPLLYKALVFGEQTSGTKPRAATAALKFLRISSVKGIPTLVREEYADFRAHAVPLVMGETFRAAFDSMGPKMEAPGKRLSDAVKAKDAAEVKAAIPAVAAGVKELRGVVRSAIAKVLSQIESACGPRIAAVAELLVHGTQAGLMRNLDKPNEEVEAIRAIPGLTGSPELAELEAAFASIRSSLMIDGTPEAAMARVLTAPDDEVEAQTLARLLPVMRDLLRGLAPTGETGSGALDLSRLEAELKLRIAGGVYGPAAGAAPVPAAGTRGGAVPAAGAPPPAPPSSSSRSFMALPWLWILCGFGVVAVVIFGFRRR